MLDLLLSSSAAFPNQLKSKSKVSETETETTPILTPEIEERERQHKDQNSDGALITLLYTINR